VLVDCLPGNWGATGSVRITPLEVRNHPFGSTLRGYDRDEVEAFLGMVAEDYEAVMREAERLREQVAVLQTRVDDFSANETILKDTLTTAQKLSEDLKNTAVKEAELVLGEAEIKAEKILDASHRRAAKLSEDIREMKMLRSRLASALRGTIETHLSMLDSLANDPSKEVIPEPLTPRPTAATLAAPQPARTLTPQPTVRPNPARPQVRAQEAPPRRPRETPIVKKRRPPIDERT